MCYERMMVNPKDFGLRKARKDVLQIEENGRARGGELWKDRGRWRCNAER
jgi:hypothetical protein